MGCTVQSLFHSCKDVQNTANAGSNPEFWCFEREGKRRGENSKHGSVEFLLVLIKTSNGIPINILK